MMDVILMGDDERNLLTTAGFIEEYYRQCRICSTFYEAYEKCEVRYCQIVGQRKYASYNSFKAALSKKK